VSFIVEHRAPDSEKFEAIDLDWCGSRNGCHFAITLTSTDSEHENVNVSGMHSVHVLLFSFCFSYVYFVVIFLVLRGCVSPLLFLSPSPLSYYTAPAPVFLRIRVAGVAILGFGI
jgi:hypothetical protein